MKLAFLSFTGKIGKSSLVNSLAYPRMRDATIIRVETINEADNSGSENEIKIKGKDIEKLETILAKTNNAIVDVGASNIESLILALNSQYESHYAVDYFIVPIKAQASAHIEMDEALKTIIALHTMGIEPERIKVLFNMLPVDSTVQDECKKVIDAHKKKPIFTLNLDAYVHESAVFSALKLAKKNYLEMLEDPTNYRQEMNKIPVEETKRRTDMVPLVRAQGTVIMVEKEMQAAWDALFGEVTK